MSEDMVIFDFFKNMDQFNQKGPIDPYSLPMMSSAMPSILLTALYLLIILRLGPKWMKNRQPFQLKPFLALYNLLQVAACIYFITNVIHSGLTLDYLWKCYKTGFTNRTQVKLYYFGFIIKGIEFIETVCFVLRKKQDQCSFLHIYHHVSTFLFAYFGVTQVGNGMFLFTYTLNMIVHTVMYSYYFVSLFIKSIDKVIAVKKSITIMQMVQFTLILVNTIRALYTECGVSKIFYAFFIPNVLIIFQQFYAFYCKAYVGKKNKDSPKKTLKKKEAAVGQTRMRF